MHVTVCCAGLQVHSLQEQAFSVSSVYQVVLPVSLSRSSQGHTRRRRLSLVSLHAASTDDYTALRGSPRRTAAGSRTIHCRPFLCKHFGAMHFLSFGAHMKEWMLEHTGSHHQITYLMTNYIIKNSWQAARNDNPSKLAAERRNIA